MGGALSGTLGSPGALRTESFPTRAPLWGSRNRLLSRREHGIVRGYLRLFLCVIVHRVCRVICGVVAWVPCEAWRPMTTPTTRPAAGRRAGRARGKEKRSGPSAAAPQAPLAAPKAPPSLSKLAPVSFFYTTLCHNREVSARPPNSRHDLNPVLGKPFFWTPKILLASVFVAGNSDGPSS